MKASGQMIEFVCVNLFLKGIIADFTLHTKVPGKETIGSESVFP